TGSVVTTTTANDTFQVAGTITCAGAGKTIAEVGLYDNATRSTVNTTWATAPTTTSGTSGTLTANAGFASGNYAQDSSGEVMLFGTVASTAVTVITRGANGSTAVAATAGDTVQLAAIPGATVTGQNLFMHANFTGIALNIGDSIAFTLQTKYT